MMFPTHNICYEFGSYRLDCSKRVLTRNRETISLTPKVTEVLMILVLNAGELVEKEELLRQVWPDTFVEEANLSQNISTLRRALGDDPTEPRYIETVPRRGYRFIAPVRAIGPEEKPHAINQKEIAVSIKPVVAVLPLLIGTGDRQLEYLSDGLTDNIINNLSRISKLRVMSHSAVFRYKGKEVDPQQAGKQMGTDAVLVGKIDSRPTGMAMSVELVDTSTGWQLWGDNFSLNRKDILEIQTVITRQVLSALKLTLTGDEEKSVAGRYTENAEAYQAYLQGRYHWSRYTRKSIEKAIEHFRHAIELDTNYALAYVGIIDCYLRLATNYLPPDDSPRAANAVLAEPQIDGPITKSDFRVKLRFEWDRKNAERELRRANELKTDYPSAYQWHAAYHAAQRIYEASLNRKTSTTGLVKSQVSETTLRTQFGSLELTVSEQVQIFCAIARDQIDSGNYDAACKILRPWWRFGDWPKIEGLNHQSCADLLFTCGDLAGCVASTGQVPKGQKHGEALLSGSIALCEQLGSHIRAAEGRIELALCYYRQGLFDLGRSTLVAVLDGLSPEEDDLRSLALIRLASLERHAGRLHDALSRLTEAAAIMELSGPWATGRCHLELASTYKDLAISDEVEDYLEEARRFYATALDEFEAVGNHRLAAIVENNLGYMLLTMDKYAEAESHLLRAHRSFDSFNDRIRCAQVDDSLARLYLAQEKFEHAEQTIERAVLTMEMGDEDALLAEALTTKGLILCRSKRYGEAKRALEDAHRLASRCGDKEGAGRALLVVMEQMSEFLVAEERQALIARLVELLSSTQQPTIRRRLQKCVNPIP